MTGNDFERRWLFCDNITTLPDRRPVDQPTVDRLALSIAKIGLQHPITVRYVAETEGGDDPSWILVAGAHRLAAVKSLGWDRVDVIVAPWDERRARLWEISENLDRAELTPLQRSENVAEWVRITEQILVEEKAAKEQGSLLDGKPAQVAPVSGGRGNSGGINAAARELGIDRTEAQRAVKVDSLSPEAKAVAVETGLDKIQSVLLDAARHSTEPAAQVAFLRGVKAARDQREQEREQKAAEKKEARADKERTLGQAIAKMPEARYGVIYADPPWKFTPYSVDTGMDRAPENHYPTMDLEAIKNLDVPAADDAVLFLWATVPMLPQALDVMREWGFVYKSHQVWVKDKAGTGYWFRNRHELLLVGTRGNIPAPAQGDQPQSAYELPVGPHSAKPAAFAEMIERLYPTLPRIELFNRGGRPGWAVWGNQATPETGSGDEPMACDASASRNVADGPRRSDELDDSEAHPLVAAD